MTNDPLTKTPFTDPEALHLIAKGLTAFNHQVTAITTLFVPTTHIGEHIILVSFADDNERLTLDHSLVSALLATIFDESGFSFAILQTTQGQILIIHPLY